MNQSSGHLERQKQQLERDKAALEEELLTRVLSANEVHAKKRLLASLNKRITDINKRIWPNKLW